MILTNKIKEQLIYYLPNQLNLYFNKNSQIKTTQQQLIVQIKKTYTVLVTDKKGMLLEQMLFLLGERVMVEIFCKFMGLINPNSVQTMESLVLLLLSQDISDKQFEKLIDSSAPYFKIIKIGNFYRKFNKNLRIFMLNLI